MSKKHLQGFVQWLFRIQLLTTHVMKIAEKGQFHKLGSFD